MATGEGTVRCCTSVRKVPLPHEHFRERGRVREGAALAVPFADMSFTHFDFSAATCRIPPG
jgi:hypothetical protein